LLYSRIGLNGLWSRKLPIVHRGRLLLIERSPDVSEFPSGARGRAVDDDHESGERGGGDKGERVMDEIRRRRSKGDIPCVHLGSIGMYPTPSLHPLSIQA
jgi:hypothetical protein